MSRTIKLLLLAAPLLLLAPGLPAQADCLAETNLAGLYRLQAGSLTFTRRMMLLK